MTVRRFLRRYPDGLNERQQDYLLEASGIDVAALRDRRRRSHTPRVEHLDGGRGRPTGARRGRVEADDVELLSSPPWCPIS